MKKQTIFILIILLCALAAGIWREHYQKEGEEQQDIAFTHLNLTEGTALKTPRSLPEFHLEDFEGNPFTQNSFKDHWSVVFFGYSSCSNICPNTLASLKELSQRLSRLPALQYVFITIDPSVDNKARLKDYLQQPTMGNNTFKGLTGENETINALSQALGVHIEDKPAGRNDVNHSPALFIINPQGQLAAVFTQSSKPHAIAHDIKELMHFYALTQQIAKRNAS